MPPIESSHIWRWHTKAILIVFTKKIFLFSSFALATQWRAKLLHRTHRIPKSFFVFAFVWNSWLILDCLLYSNENWSSWDFQRSIWFQWNIALKLNFRFFFYYFSGGSAYLLCWRTNTSKQTAHEYYWLLHHQVTLCQRFRTIFELRWRTAIFDICEHVTMCQM